MIRLGLVLDQVVFERDGTHSTDEPFVQFVEHVASALFDQIQFCTRVRPAAAPAPYDLPPPFYEILALPWYRDVGALCVRSPALLPRIIRLLRNAMTGWDMVIVGAIHPLAPLVLRMARRRRLPSVLWIRGSYLGVLRHRLAIGPVRRTAGMGVARLVLAGLPSGTPVISSGRDDYPFLARMGPAHVVYTSKFGIEDFATLPRPPRRPGEPARLLYVGRIAPEKGLDVLLEAFRRLRKDLVEAPVSLTIVGSDFYGSPYGEAFRERVNASDLGPSAVRWVGYVPYGRRLFELYDAHDVFALPSFTEGFPQVIFEAMARGLPVVSTSVGGVPRIVRHEENGLLVDPGDPDGLAGAVRRVLTDPALAARLAQNAQRSLVPYTRQAQVDAVVQFIKTCFPQAPFAGRRTQRAGSDGGER